MGRTSRPEGLDMVTQGGVHEHKRRRACFSAIPAPYRAEGSGCSLRVVFHICWPMCHQVTSAKQTVCYVRVTGCAFLLQKHKAFK